MNTKKLRQIKRNVKEKQKEMLVKEVLPQIESLRKSILTCLCNEIKVSQHCRNLLRYFA